VSLAGHARSQDATDGAVALPAQEPARGVVSDGELTATAACVNVERTRNFKDAANTAKVVVLGKVEASAPTTIYAADRSLVIDEVLDQRGRSMLLPQRDGKLEDDSGADWLADAYPFTDLRYVSRGMRPWWPVQGERAIDPDPRRSVTTVFARFGATIATSVEVIDLPLAGITPSLEMIPLLPDAHMTISELHIGNDGTTSIAFALWLHNLIEDASTVRPVIRSEEEVALFYNDDDEYDTPGHDDREPPFLYSMELIDQEGRVVGRVSDGASGRVHWTGQYWAGDDKIEPSPGTGKPTILRIRMITDAVRSELPVELQGVDEVAREVDSDRQ